MNTYSQAYSHLAARYCARIDRLRVLLRVYQQCMLYSEATLQARRIAEAEQRAKDCVNRAIMHLGKR